MKLKLIICLFLASISSIVFAQKIQPIAIQTDGHVTPSQEKLITNAFL